MKNSEYVNSIKSKLREKIVPEFGRFEPVNVVFDLECDDRFTFTIKHDDASNSGKMAIFAYLNSKTGRMAASSVKFSNKEEMDRYIEKLTDEDIKKTLSDIKNMTE